MDTTAAVARLSRQLPLQARQARLNEACRRLHRDILWTLIRQGRALSRDEMARQLGEREADACLQQLGGDDLVVLDANGTELLGAYPLTTEKTAHGIDVAGHRIYAMCALDAVSVAPVFNCNVKISSHCHISKAPVVIEMDGSDILAVTPSPDVQVGVRWQMPVGHAAHSMCTEMVFLKDVDIARQWQGGEEEAVSLFSLPAAVAFGAAFFQPLLQ